MSLRRANAKKRGRPPREPSSRVWKIVKGNEPSAKTYHPAEYMMPLEGLEGHAAKDKRFSRAVSNLKMLDGALKPGSVTQAWYRRKMLYKQKEKAERMRKERERDIKKQENYVLENDKRDKKTRALNAEFMSELSEGRRIAIEKQLRNFLVSNQGLNAEQATRQAQIFASTVPDLTKGQVPNPGDLETRLNERTTRVAPFDVNMSKLGFQIPVESKSTPGQLTAGDIAAFIPSGLANLSTRFKDIGRSMPVQTNLPP